MPDHVTREIDLPVAPAEAWAWLTEPEALGSWLGADVDLDVRPAGRGSFRFADGEIRFAVVEHVDVGRELAFRWWPARARRREPGRDRARAARRRDDRAGHRDPDAARDVAARPARRARLRVNDRARPDDAIGAVFSALADPTRTALLVDRLADRPATATELALVVPVSRQAVVKHLQALDAAGLVERTRDGRAVRFRLHPHPLDDAVDWMTPRGAGGSSASATCGSRSVPSSRGS